MVASVVAVAEGRSGPAAQPRPELLDDVLVPRGHEQEHLGERNAGSRSKEAPHGGRREARCRRARGRGLRPIAFRVAATARGAGSGSTCPIPRRPRNVINTPAHGDLPNPRHCSMSAMPPLTPNALIFERLRQRAWTGRGSIIAEGPGARSALGHRRRLAGAGRRPGGAAISRHWTEVRFGPPTVGRFLDVLHREVARRARTRPFGLDKLDEAQRGPSQPRLAPGWTPWPDTVARAHRRLKAAASSSDRCPTAQLCAAHETWPRHAGLPWGRESSRASSTAPTSPSPRVYLGRRPACSGLSAPRRRCSSPRTTPTSRRARACGLLTGVRASAPAEIRRQGRRTTCRADPEGGCRRDRLRGPGDEARWLEVVDGGRWFFCTSSTPAIGRTRFTARLTSAGTSTALVPERA